MDRLTEQNNMGAARSLPFVPLTRPDEVPHSAEHGAEVRASMDSQNSAASEPVKGAASERARESSEAFESTDTWLDTQQSFLIALGKLLYLFLRFHCTRMFYISFCPREPSKHLDRSGTSIWVWTIIKTVMYSLRSIKEYHGVS